MRKEAFAYLSVIISISLITGIIITNLDLNGQSFTEVVTTVKKLNAEKIR